MCSSCIHTFIVCVCMCYRTVLKMAKRHSKSERQRLKNMLSDAIRVLCQNTVRYNVELSIEALIGVTVDGGTDVVIVSLNELIGKQAADTTFSDEQYYNTPADGLYNDEQVEYMEDETGDYPGAEDDDQDYDNSGESGMPYGTVIKEELMSTVTYGNVGQNHYQPSAALAVARYNTEPYVDDAQQYYEEPANPQNVGLQQGWPSPAKPVIRKSRAAVSEAQKRIGLASPGGKKLGKVGAKVSQDGVGLPKPASVGKMQSLNGEDAVAQITLYTCGTCGAQMQHYASFQRHKRSHTGQHTFYCKGCGKEIRRHDNLLTHQRRCQAYLNMFPHTDPAS